MARPVTDWRRATFVGAIAGGLFWGFAAGMIVASKASAVAIITICVAGAVMVVVGPILFRRSISPTNRALGIGVTIAPLTGLAPLITMWVPGLLTYAVS